MSQHISSIKYCPDFFFEISLITIPNIRMINVIFSYYINDFIDDWTSFYFSQFSLYFFITRFLIIQTFIVKEYV